MAQYTVYHQYALIDEHGPDGAIRVLDTSDRKDVLQRQIGFRGREFARVVEIVPPKDEPSSLAKD